MRTIRVLALLCLWLAIPCGLGHAGAQTPAAGLTWAPCPPVDAGTATPGVAADAGLECATLSVPLDYADPDGEQIAIGINRLPARDPAQRIGSLIFNPGGPGGAGVAVVAREAAARRSSPPRYSTAST